MFFLFWYFTFCIQQNNSFLCSQEDVIIYQDRMIGIWTKAPQLYSILGSASNFQFWIHKFSDDSYYTSKNLCQAIFGGQKNVITDQREYEPFHLI